MRRIRFGLTIGTFTAVLSVWGAVNLNVLWDSTTTRGGRTNEAQSVALQRNRVIVGEALQPMTGPDTDIVIKGFNTGTGNLVWMDEFLGAESTEGSVVPRVFVAAANDYAIAVGRIPERPDHTNLLVRAYTLSNGMVRWTRYLTLDQVRGIGLVNSRLVVVGHTGLFIPGIAQIVTLNAVTGVPLWNASVQNIDSTMFSDVAIVSGNVIALGHIIPRAGPNTLIVRSYRLMDGQLNWEHTERNVTVSKMRIAHDVAYLGGSEISGTEKSYLAALATSDGHPLWKALSTSNGNFNLVAATGKIVVAIGFTRIELHDASTGAALWAKDITNNLIRGVIPLENSIVTIGTEFRPLGQQVAIRVYDSAGNVAFEDVRDISGRIWDAAFLDNRLAIVGNLAMATGVSALVRVYGVSNH